MTCKISCFFWALLIAIFAAPTTQAQTAPPFSVVGYLPEYRFATFRAESTNFLTDLVLFSVEPQPNGALNSSRITTDIIRRVNLLPNRARLKVSVAVGGWGRSQNFLPMTQNAATRARFIREIVVFCVRNRLNGIDFDWEHPQTTGQLNAYNALIIETKSAARAYGLMVTVALAPWQMLSPAALQALDRVHLMTYDYERILSPLDRCLRDVEYQIQRGAPRGKMCLGIPFYGRQEEDFNEEISYNVLMQMFHPEPELDSIDGWSYNGPRTAELKTRAAKQRGLRGVIVWEIGQDTNDSSSLLRAIARGANNTSL